MRRPILLALLLSACAPKMVAPPNITESGTIGSLTAPPPAEFIFGAGDRISIRVWRHTELDMDLTIAPDGGFTFPLLGRVQAAGVGYPQLTKQMEEGLSAYYNDVAVAINIQDISNQKVFVLGQVRTPTVLQIHNDLSILEALTRTGGIDEDARTDNILLIRGGLDEPQLYSIDVESIFGEGDISQLVYLQRGDIVVVPPKTIANVERFFRRIQAVLAPFVGGTAIYRNAVSGGAQGTSSALSD